MKLILFGIYCLLLSQVDFDDNNCQNVLIAAGILCACYGLLNSDTAKVKDGND